MSLEHRCRRAVDGLAVGDVADLCLAAELLREGLQTLAAAGEQDAAPAAAGEPAGDLRADATRGARDDGYSLNVRTVSTLMATVSSIGSA